MSCRCMLLLSRQVPGRGGNESAVSANGRTGSPGCLGPLLSILLGNRVNLLRGGSETRGGRRELSRNVKLAHAHVGVMSNDLWEDIAGFVCTRAFEATETVGALSTSSLGTIGSAVGCNARNAIVGCKSRRIVGSSIDSGGHGGVTTSQIARTLISVRSLLLFSNGI